MNGSSVWTLPSTHDSSSSRTPPPRGSQSSCPGSQSQKRTETPHTSQFNHGEELQLALNRQSSTSTSTETVANATKNQLLLDNHKPTNTTITLSKLHPPKKPRVRKHKAVVSGHSRVHTCTCVPLFPFPLLPPPTPCLCCWEPVISAILLSICSSRSNMDILNWLSGLEKARVRTFPWKGSSGFDRQLQKVTNSYPGNDRGDLSCLQMHIHTCPAVS